jgi:hypothetical protein
MQFRPLRREWTAAAALIVTAAALLLWAVGLPGPPVREDGERDRVAARATLESLLEVFPPPGARAFPGWRELSRVGPPVPSASGPVGFEGLRLCLQRDEGSVRWNVGVLLDTSGQEARAVAALIECMPSDPRSPWDARRLREDWPHPTERAGEGWRARWRDLRYAAELEGRARGVLGGHRPVEVPSYLADAYELLLDPLRPIVYVPAGEDPCGPAAGRVAMDRLLSAGRDDLIRNVLRGLDPEGRVYACEALLGELEPEREDRLALAYLLSLDLRIRLRDGALCTAREALGPLALAADPLTR